MRSRLAAAAAVFLMTLNAWAAYPERPLRLIVPSSPGSGPDVVGRIYAARLGSVLGQQVVVDNRAGANSIIGSETVARATPDGYTLLITSGSHVTNPHVYKKLPYDALRDFTPISWIVTSTGLVLVTHPNFPAKTIEQLIEMARNAPGKYAYASAGVGNLQHLAGAMFNVMANVNLTHVPYKGGGAAINDVLAAQIAVNFASSPAAVPFVKAGRLRALGFTGKKRSSQLPDVPTLDEAGLKGYEVIGWYGVYGPAKLPKPIVMRVYQASRDAVHTPETRKQFSDINIEVVGSTPEEFTRLLKDDLVRYAKVIKAAGIEPQ